ncbi:two-component system sensor histidine kinase CreC [Variovorax sp. VNK109]|uniref:two-component system sensor histidine kinase CreC n=1 Tax=Variovorax sp. VNK109 TaxID=3400919 RepID=UPI003C10B870
MRNRIFIGILLIYAAGLAFFVYRAMMDIDPRYRESAEESLVETSHMLASVIEQDLDEYGEIDTPRLEALFRRVYARPFEAQIFSVHKTRVELRVYVTDSQGLVIFNSLGRDLEADYSAWLDVSQTLAGRYGARTTRDVESDPLSAVMYVGAPILHDGRIIGVVSAGKPVQSFGQFVEAARQNTLRIGVLAASAVLLLAAIVSVWLIRPFGFVRDYVRWLRQQRTLHPMRLLRRLRDQLRGTVAELRDALSGRNYVADYVQTLTHEVKSPLSAIRGAAELLQDAEGGDAPQMNEQQRKLFLDNIMRETQRIQETVDRMMELTALETQRTLNRVATVALLPLLEDVAASAGAAAAPRGIHVKINAPGGNADILAVDGDAFLLRRAIANLVDNAVAFSPDGGEVVIGLQAAGRQLLHVSVKDQGPGIPAYAQDKVFEKFYSLARPATQKKSTGLGLAFVHEIASLHHGSIKLANAPGGGAVATLTLPRDTA